MSAIPPSIRKIIDSGRGEVAQLQRQYHIWMIVTILAASVGIILLLTSILLFMVDFNSTLSIARILIGLAMGADFIVFYVVFQETLSRRRYLLEVQRLMVSGLSFLDSVRRGFKDLFK